VIKEVSRVLNGLKIHSSKDRVTNTEQCLQIRTNGTMDDLFLKKIDVLNNTMKKKTDDF